MSSDYIPRLRHELLRAGAAAPPAGGAPSGKQPGPLAPEPSRSRGRAGPGARGRRASATRARWRRGDARSHLPRRPPMRRRPSRRAQVMRDGSRDGHRRRRCVGRVRWRRPGLHRFRGRQGGRGGLTQRGQVAFYDWERSVLGPGGRPAPADESVTGGENAARGGGVTRAEAESRAAKADAGGSCAASTPERKAGSRSAASPRSRQGHRARHRSGRRPDEGGGRRHRLHLPRPAAFTHSRGRSRSAAASGADGVEAMQANLHFAILIDDRIVSVPYIDFRVNPDGVDGSSGAQVSGGLTEEERAGPPRS